MIRWALVAVAMCVLVGAWSLTHHVTAKRNLIVDTPIYEKYGDAIVRGKAPYRDVRIEYPPAALPMFILPSLGHVRDAPAYDRWFDREMAVCACLTLLGLALLTSSAPALALAATAPILLGPVVLTRFDYWPTALATLALAALVRRRLVLAAVVLGVAISAKVWPGVILPFAVAWLWRTRDPRVASRFAAGVAAVVAAIFTPFAILSPGGVWYGFHQQLARPLQIESLGAAVLAVVHDLFGTNLGILSTYGSQNIGGSATRATAAVTNVLLALALAYVFASFLRREPSRERFLTACAAAVAALIAFGKVFSPQYLVWLVPLVPLAESAAAGVLFVLSLLLTQLYFPSHYWGFGRYFYLREALEVLARDVVVVVLFVVLTRALRRAPAPRPASAPEAARARPAESARPGS